MILSQDSENIVDLCPPASELYIDLCRKIFWKKKYFFHSTTISNGIGTTDAIPTDPMHEMDEMDEMDEMHEMDDASVHPNDCMPS